MHPIETKEPLSTTIPTIVATHVLAPVPTFLSSTLYSTLSTAKHEMDYLLRTLHPQPPSFGKLHVISRTSSPLYPHVPSWDASFHTPLKAEVLARQFEQSHHLTLNMGSNNHSLAVTRYVNRFFRNTPSNPSTTIHQSLRSQAQAPTP
jgi:hypothetical protein